VQTRAQLLDLVADLAATGSAVVYSTHYLPEVEQLGASVVIIDRGEVIARGAVAELVSAHAASAVELRFDGPAPDVVVAGPDDRVERDGAVLRVYTRTPDAATTAVIEQLGENARHLRGLEVAHPSLESVFLGLTGRRYAPAEVAVGVG
jgi:ABC-2 type transport system ATP-binding protein